MCIKCVTAVLLHLGRLHAQPAVHLCWVLAVRVVPRTRGLASVCLTSEAPSSCCCGCRRGDVPQQSMAGGAARAGAGQAAAAAAAVTHSSPAAKGQLLLVVACLKYVWRSGADVTGGMPLLGGPCQ